MTYYADEEGDDDEYYEYDEDDNNDEYEYYGYDFDDQCAARDIDASTTAFNLRPKVLTTVVLLWSESRFLLRWKLKASFLIFL